MLPRQRTELQVRAQLLRRQLCLLQRPQQRPTTPTVAFKLGEKNADPLAMYAEDVNTVAVNLAGLPAISLPAGFSGGMPVGLQLIAPAFEEARLLNAAHKLQEATDFHLRQPAGLSK